MKIVISREDGKWLVNGKPFSEMSFAEQNILNEFFKQMKNESSK